MIDLNWKLIDQYLEAGASGLEISARLGIHENTLYQRCKTDKIMDFVEYKAQKRASGDVLLKVAQFDTAVNDKNVSMQIWLGKQRLGQSDKQESLNVNVQTSDTMTKEQLELEVQKAREVLS
jgi:hypothetical protein